MRLASTSPYDTVYTAVHSHAAPARDLELDARFQVSHHLANAPAVIRSAPPSRSVWSTHLRFLILFLPIPSALDHRVARRRVETKLPKLVCFGNDS
jgi:hypothetical protein